jgi:hypothetical protein
MMRPAAEPVSKPVPYILLPGIRPGLSEHVSLATVFTSNDGCVSNNNQRRQREILRGLLRDELADGLMFQPYDFKQPLANGLVFAKTVKSGFVGTCRRQNAELLWVEAGGEKFGTSRGT